MVKKKQPNLKPLLIERSPDRGGVISMGLGRLGSGKTNGLIHTARRIFERKVRAGRELKRMKNPASGKSEAYAKRMIASELVFWIGTEDCQWRRLPKWLRPLLFVERGLKLKFYLDGKPFDPLAIPFNSFKDLMEHVQANRVNVLYMSSPHTIREFVMYLIRTPSLGWASVVVDEIENIIPGYESGETWHRVDSFVKLIKRSRKRRISIYGATQVKSLCDHRFVSLVSFWFLHVGTRAIPQSRVFQGAIDKLKIDEAWLATSAQFQKVSFPFYPAFNDMVVQGLEEYEVPKPPSKKVKKVA